MGNRVRKRSWFVTFYASDKNCPEGYWYYTKAKSNGHAYRRSRTSFGKITAVYKVRSSLMIKSLDRSLKNGVARYRIPQPGTVGGVPVIGK